MLLEERSGQRQLLIWIAGAEASSMALRLSGMGPPARPLGSDLTAALVEALGGRLVEVRIDRLDQQTFYATVVVDGLRGPVEIDARPSDALNLALVVGVPVLVEGGVLERAIAEEPQVQHHRMVLDTDLPQPRRATSGDRDRDRIGRVGLAAVPGRQHAHPGGQLSRHIDDMLAVGGQLLGRARGRRRARPRPPNVGDPSVESTGAGAW